MKALTRITCALIIPFSATLQAATDMLGIVTKIHDFVSNGIITAIVAVVIMAIGIGLMVSGKIGEYKTTIIVVFSGIMIFYGSLEIAKLLL